MLNLFIYIIYIIFFFQPPKALQNKCNLPHLLPKKVPIWVAEAHNILLPSVVFSNQINFFQTGCHYFSNWILVIVLVEGRHLIFICPSFLI